MDVNEAPPASGKPRSRGSLRLKIGGWTVAVFTVTLAIFTAAGIIEDRRQILQSEAAQAQALLKHFAEMPGFQRDFPTAISSLASIRSSVGPAGEHLELVSSDQPASGPVAARSSLAIGDGAFELRYLSDVKRLNGMTRRSIVLHVTHAILTLAILLAGTEWILRRKLIAPLKTLSHQVDRMRDGGGWLPVVPATDAELEGLAAAVRGLGPALEEQVHRWVNAERHSAVTLALGRIRAGLTGPLRNIRGLVGDLEARHLVAPTGKPKLRSILGNLDLVREALQIEEEVELAHSRWPGPPPAGGPQENGARSSR